MTIKINTHETLTPIQIGDLHYEINLTDKKYRQFMEQFQATQAELLAVVKQIEEAEDESAIDETETEQQLHHIVKSAYDDLLGEGAFSAVYEQTPRIVHVTVYLMRLITAIEQEMSMETDHQASSYLEAKNAKLNA